MKILLRLLGYIKKYWFIGLISLTCLLAVMLLEMLIPWLTKHAIDQAIPNKDIHLLKKLVLYAAGVSLARFLFTFVHRRMTAQMVQRTLFDLRNALFNSMQRLSFSYHDRTQSGQLMSRVTSDIQNIERFIGFGVLNFIQLIVVFVIVTVILISMNPFLSLLSMLVVPFVIYTVIKFAGIVRPLYSKVREQYGVMTDVLQENILGVKVVKAFGRERHEIGKFSNITLELVNREMKAIKEWAFYNPFIFFLSSIGTITIVVGGGYQIIHGTMTVGELVAFNSYFFMIVSPMRTLGRIVNLSQRATAAGQRIFEVLDEEREIRDKKEAIVLGAVKGKIEFRNVNFSYPDTMPVLKNINLVINPGETVALVGPTGSGKSTISNLIPRFYDPASGVISLDDHNVKDIQLESLRRKIGLVFQETFLFSASVAQNIAYGHKDATEKQIEECARLAQVHDFIITLPNGYNTIIGERGVDLSGGQKQRIAIARALLMNPQILILDDSTSSVDVETELSLQDALKSVMKDRTNIIIAHRFSSIKYADRIIVMDNGMIVGQGSHEHLIQTCELYKKIYQIQFASEV